MALAHQFNYLNVTIGTVDFTSYLTNTEQVATVPIGSEIGRATLTFRDDGTLPVIQEWGTVVIKAGTAAPGTPVWGGFATRQSSEPVSMDGGPVSLVTVDCQSYAIRLATTEPISDTYGGGNNESILMDYVIVDDLVGAYLPAFYDAGSISSTSPVQCDYIQFGQESLRSALNKVVERSAKEFGITAGAQFYYRPTGSLSPQDQILTEDPDYDETFPMQAKPYFDDDAVELRNAVRVLGGWTVSAIQTETFLTDGIAYAFQVDYFPQQIISVTLANIPQTVGVYLVDDPADFDCLVHYDQRKFYYQLPPSSGKTLEIAYRYPVRVAEDVLDSASIAAVGGTLWGPAIVDSSISDGAVAQRIGSAYLAAATASIERGQITTSWVGTAAMYLPGQIIKVSATALGWESNQLEIQAVTMRFAPRPGGVGSCLTYWDMDVGSPLSVGRTMGESFINAPETTNWKEAPRIERGLTEGDIPTLDHGTALTGLGDDDHSQYLLAMGTRTGASSQAQVFTNGVSVPQTTGLVTIGDAKVFSVHDASWGHLYANVTFTPVDTNKDQVFRFMPSGSADSGVLEFYNDKNTLTDYSRIIFKTFTDRFWIRGQKLGTGALLPIYIGANGTESQLALLTNGNVGIGTTAPYSVLHASLNNATTAATDYVLTLTHNSTGTPSTYFGAGILFLLESSTTSDQAAATIAAFWADATHSTRTSAISINTINQAASYQAAEFGGTTGNVFNGDETAWCDFRVAGDTSTNLLFVDASADAVGLGTATPTTRLHIQQTSADTNVVRNLLTIEHQSTGTPAAGLGAGLLFALESTTTAGMSAATLDASWSEATHDSRKGQARLWAHDNSAARLGLTIGTNGSAALVGLYAAAPVAQATTAGAAASFTANSGTAVNDASTFDGYTIKQIVKALRNLGALA